MPCDRFGSGQIKTTAEQVAINAMLEDGWEIMRHEDQLFMVKGEKRINIQKRDVLIPITIIIDPDNNADNRLIHTPRRST